MTPAVVLPRYTILADAIEADIYLANTDGKLLLFVSGSHSDYNEVDIPKNIISEACAAGEYQEVGKVGGLYSQNHYTVGIPVKTESGVPAAVIFASASAGTLTVFLKEILKMFIIRLARRADPRVRGGLLHHRRPRAPAAQDGSPRPRAFPRGISPCGCPVESYDEIGQLAISFNNMATSLATTEVARRSFTANVSHELRTPMTTIAGFIDGILDGTIPPEKRDDYLKIVSEEIKRLSRLVRSMLNIARIEAGELELRPDLFDVNDTVIRTVFTFEQPLEAKNIEVRGLDGGKVMVEADPDLIHQVVYNLIENAVKFCNEGGFIDVNYSEDDSYTSVGIRNTGDGIPKDEIPHIFDRFYKADKSRSRDKGGAGLGLHIVRSIVNLHGGDIIVRSVEGEYCEFVFTIPKPHKSKKN